VTPKIILYELNEVPRRLLDFYIKIKPNSAFAEVSKNGLILNTITRDNGELHPWSTWPTVHRGIYNEFHNIRFLNQDLSHANLYKPVWEILSENLIKTGVFGSLQSHPPLINKNINFYLPDTFSPDANAYPKELNLFQEFNLIMAGENKAISRSIGINQIKLFTNLLFKNVISPKATFKTLAHIIKEKYNPKFKARRSTLQNVLAFDLFFKTVNKYKPNFCTYFTNHVAGIMHRYWKDLFPEDFNIGLEDIDKFHSNSIIKAMDLANNDLSKLIKLSKKEDYNIWIISSMGQDANQIDEYIPELMIRNFNKLLFVLGLNKKSYKLLPAMQPDYIIEAVDNRSLKLIRNALKGITDKEGQQLIIERYPPEKLTLNISLLSSKSLIKSLFIKFKEKNLPIKSLGFELIQRDVGSAYHIPEGIFCLYGNDIYRFEKYKDQQIETSRICPTILKTFGIDRPSYMQESL